MASLIGYEIDIDYSIVDGRIRSLELNGEVLVDNGTGKPGWKEKLWDWAVENNMHTNYGHGWGAWVIWLAQELGKPLAGENK